MWVLISIGSLYLFEAVYLVVLTIYEAKEDTESNAKR